MHLFCTVARTPVSIGDQTMPAKITLSDLNELMPADEAIVETGFVPEKDQKYEVVSIVAYLIGVRKNTFGENRNFEEGVYRRLNLNKTARIIRNLCILRSALIHRGSKVYHEWQHNGRQVLQVSEYIPQDAVCELLNDGIRLPQKPTMSPIEYTVELNRLISDRINNCKSLVPDWINWQYIRDLFIMPAGKTTDGIKSEITAARSNYGRLPYQAYINWSFGETDGNVLLNDRKFCTLLYSRNFDIFSDMSKVTDVSRKIKGDIYDFLAGGHKVDMIVDCENSDVYNIISMLHSLEWEHLQKVSKIILINDSHTNPGWQELEKCTEIPIEHIMVQRLLEEKSLVDGMVIAKVYTEFYENKVTSFVLLSSDSDFWTIISGLKGKADFLVMVEHEKCSPNYKEILAESGVLCCYLDDFNSSGESEELRNDILLRTIDAALAQKQFNIEELLRDALSTLRISMDDTHRRQFFSKHLKALKMTIDENGEVRFESKR